MSLAEARGAGRARSATSETRDALPPRAKPQRWQPAVVATPGEVNFHHVRLREYLGNLLNEEGGVFAHVDGDARKLIKELLHCRNPDTGKCCPSWPYLARAIGDSDRNVGYILGRLDSGPSRQSDGRVVEGHGLIWRRRNRSGFRRLATQYGITCQFLVLAGLVLPHNCMECRCGAAWGAEERGSITSGSSDLSHLVKSSKNEREQRSRARSPSLKIFSSASEENDSRLTAFFAVFDQQRFAKYGNNDHGTLVAENREKLSSFLADLVGGAWAWSEQEGCGGAPAEVASALFERLVRLWLDWPGSNGLLRDRRHPVGLLIGDLEKFGKLACASWKRAQRKLKPFDAHEAPEGAVSLTDYVSQLQHHEPDAWPELDASEPDAGELAELAALALLQVLAPAQSLATVLGADTEEEHQAEGPIELAQVRRSLAARGQTDEQAAQARALLAALFPSADRDQSRATSGAPSAEAAGLATPLGSIELGFDAGKAGLGRFNLAGEQEQRRDGIGDDHACGANGGEDRIEDKIGAVDDVSPALGGGGGPVHCGIESSKTGVGEADRNVVVRDGAAICLPGASHQATVPRSEDTPALGGIGVSRKGRGRGALRSVRVTRQSPRPVSRSLFHEPAKDHEKGEIGTGISVTRERAAPPGAPKGSRVECRTSGSLNVWESERLDPPFAQKGAESCPPADVPECGLRGEVPRLLLALPLGVVGDGRRGDDADTRRAPAEELGSGIERCRSALKEDACPIASWVVAMSRPVLRDPVEERAGGEIRAGIDVTRERDATPGAGRLRTPEFRAEGRLDVRTSGRSEQPFSRVSLELHGVAGVPAEERGLEAECDRSVLEEDARQVVLGETALSCSVVCKPSETQVEAAKGAGIDVSRDGLGEASVARVDVTRLSPPLASGPVSSEPEKTHEKAAEVAAIDGSHELVAEAAGPMSLVAMRAAARALARLPVPKPLAPVVLLFPADPYPCETDDTHDSALRDDPDHSLADNDTGDDPEFFARELDRAGKEIAFLAELEAEEHGAADVAAEGLGGAAPHRLWDCPLGMPGEGRPEYEADAQRVPAEERGNETERGLCSVLEEGTRRVIPGEKVVSRFVLREPDED